MNPPAILAPAAALVCWSLIMLSWLALARLPYLHRQGFNPPRGTRGPDIEKAEPGPANWPAHNYNHLMEQPTLFYAVTLILAAAERTIHADLVAAWTYVALRVAHSIVQGTINIVPLRFVFFFSSSLCLIYLAIRALEAFLPG